MPAVFFLAVRLFPPPKKPTFAVFERLFRERGLPANIRSDNGVPFASAHALFNPGPHSDPPKLRFHVSINPIQIAAFFAGHSVLSPYKFGDTTFQSIALASPRGSRPPRAQFS